MTPPLLEDRPDRRRCEDHVHHVLKVRDVKERFRHVDDVAFLQDGVQVLPPFMHDPVGVHLEGLALLGVGGHPRDGHPSQIGLGQGAACRVEVIREVVARTIGHLAGFAHVAVNEDRTVLGRVLVDRHGHQIAVLELDVLRFIVVIEQAIGIHDLGFVTAHQLAGRSAPVDLDLTQTGRGLGATGGHEQIAKCIAQGQRVLAGVGDFARDLDPRAAHLDVAQGVGRNLDDVPVRELRLESLGVREVDGLLFLGDVGAYRELGEAGLARGGARPKAVREADQGIEGLTGNELIRARLGDRAFDLGDMLGLRDHDDVACLQAWVLRGVPLANELHPIHRAHLIALLDGDLPQRALGKRTACQ